jgi:phosphoglucomutase
MGAGFSLMNDVTVLQASQGLASYVGRGSVVIGHDHRLNSQRFAEITATVFLLKGFKVHYLVNDEHDGFVPTPLVPFTVDQMGASVGVMITASHNPALDNGYKVYWSNGCQIIPPRDDEIATAILENLEPLEGSHDLKRAIDEGLKNGQLEYVKTRMIDRYIQHLKQLVKKQVTIPFVYTPMHGVGLEAFARTAQLLNTFVTTVTEQSEPDPFFSTVKFPNPEEKGALELAMARADELGIKLIIANDPDADRFSAAVKVGEWRQLTGNELGFLFANHILKTTDAPLDKVYMVNSTVSSQMINAMSKKLGFHYVETLTGFKWIGNKAIDLESKGYEVPFGFEEAIGFMFNGIHDKDGISSAVVFLQMAQQWQEEGTNALEVLEQGFKNFGYFKEYNSYYTVHDPSFIKPVFEKIRGGYDEYPEHIGDFKVTYWRDLTIGYDSSTLDHRPLLPVDSGSQMITAVISRDQGQIRFTMRGSGTEPKLKVYVEAQADGEDEALALAQQVWNLLKKEWFSELKEA